MNRQLIGRFKVSQGQSDAFSALSGDCNPLHLNSITARRYQFGGTVIHGVFGTLLALDCFAASRSDNWQIDSISVQYTRPVRHEEEAEVYLFQPESGGWRLEVRSLDKLCQVISVETTARAVISELVDTPAQLEEPDDLEFCDAASAKGEIPLFWQQSIAKILVTDLTSSIPAQQLAVILGLTQIVGMKCPGMNSIFGGFELDFSASAGEYKPVMQYEVSKVDERFKLAVVEISHPTAAGKIHALFRAAPVRQSSYAEVSELLANEDCKAEFADEKALVIGGSRGLGEVAAKIIAASGGRVIIGYARGEREAEQLADEINQAGGQAETLGLDVLDHGSFEAAAIAARDINALYYFASPLIEKNETKTFDSALFDRFSRFYLHGFSALLANFQSDSTYRNSGLKIFCPSTAYIDEMPDGFTEYVCAKIAAEQFADYIRAKHPHWRVVTPRLPRLPTDQTAAVAKEDPQATVTLLAKLMQSGVGNSQP